MKKKFRILGILLMLVVSIICSIAAIALMPDAETPVEDTAEVTEPELTEEPVEVLPAPEPIPEPDTVPATVRKDDTHAIVGTFERGDIVDIIDESNDEYYVVQDIKGFF